MLMINQVFSVKRQMSLDSLYLDQGLIDMATKMEAYTWDDGFLFGLGRKWRSWKW